MAKVGETMKPLIIAFFLIFMINIIGYSRDWEHYPYLIGSHVYIEEKFSGDIYPSLRYFSGILMIKIKEENDPEPTAELECIRFSMFEKEKRIGALPFKFSTKDGTIQDVNVLEDDSFSFLINFPPFNKILIKGTPLNGKINIEGHGNYIHWDKDETLYPFTWKSIPKVTLPNWKICYSSCLFD